MAQEDISRRLKSERKFHDDWAKTMKGVALYPGRCYGCPTLPEITYGIDSLGDVRGKRIMALGAGGAGSGELLVFLAQNGAQVVVADISFQMCTVTRELASRHEIKHLIHSVTTAAEFLALPDSFFDLVFGENVLHHLDLDRAMPEIYRVLKNNGKAVFIEPLGHNPILSLFRRLSPAIRTEFEHPLKMKDIKKIASFFSHCRHSEFHLNTLLLFLWFYVGECSDPNKVRYWEKIVYEAEKYSMAFKCLYAMDKILLAIVPYLKRHCRMTVIECWGEGSL